LKRDEIFERDDWRCVYCGEVFPPEELTLDHVQPRVRGGDRSHGNLVTACKACNTRKGSLRLSAFLHADVAARSHFFQRATHVWPRLLRIVGEELGALDGCEPAREAAPREKKS